jgi:carbonic anhydrase/acetyltransferase-like protein (isoleucine patch superfamily)
MSNIHPDAYIHPAAFVCGDVSLGAAASVWPFAVLRADTDRIVVGARTNVQDGAVIHVDAGVPATIGEGVAIGHRAIVHGATVGAGALIGMGAVVLNHVRVGAGAIVAAGALCPEGMVIPDGMLVVGVPARVVRPVSDAERARIAHTVASYVALQARHRAGEFPPLGSR